MKKTVVLFLLLMSVASFASGKGDSFSGTLTVSFGKVRNPDGTMRSIAGLKLPFTAERIRATKIQRVKKVGHGPFVPTLDAPGSLGKPTGSNLLALLTKPAMPFSVTTVYNADAGSQYGVIEGSDPTSLDDMVMAGGSNLPWQNLTFGVDIASVHNFLIRWIGYTHYTEGLGHDAQAFSGVFADFGVIFPTFQNPGIGTWKITISVAAAGVVAPTDAIFMAQQFRSPQPDGEGPFDTELRNVYNPIAPPTIGSSDDVFWFDWDPMNAIYAEDEIDNFGAGTFANMLRTITVSGTQESLVPFAYTLVQGIYQSGSITDFWFSDDSYFIATPNFALGRTTPPIQISVTGLSSTATVNSLKFTAEIGSPTAGGTQTISLFNYLTNAYDVVDTRAIAGPDATVDITITNNPSKYINASNRNVKTLIAFFPPSAASRGWNLKVDMAKWTITKP